MNTETQTEVPQGTSSEEQQKKQPVKKYVTKGGISATVWSDIKETDGKKIEYFNTTIERKYTTDNGITWQSTNSMRTEDLPKVALVSEQAYKYIVMKQLGN